MNNMTGQFLNEQEIKLGDKLQGKQTAEVVVLWDEENNEYGVELVGKPECWVKLDYFLSKWNDLEVTGNVNKRT